MPIREITVAELEELGPDVAVVDVREPDEWDEGHIAHAVHVPLATVPDHVDRFAASPTYVVCRSGGRSMRACEFLAAQDLDVVNVAGGMLAWLDAGFAVAQGPSADA